MNTMYTTELNKIEELTEQMRLPNEELCSKLASLEARKLQLEKAYETYASTLGAFRAAQKELARLLETAND